MIRIFAYIEHKKGVAADTAWELLSAARKIDAGASITALISGQGAQLDTVAEEVAERCEEVWKFAHDELGYPNAEVLRPLLVSTLPAGSIFLLAHSSLGMDLGPGLSINLDGAFVSDVVDIKGLEGCTLKLVRQEFGGQVGTHVMADISRGAVLTLRPGSFVPAASVRRGKVIDKSDEIGGLPAKRRFLKVVEAEADDVDITNKEILVSIGRGIEAEENIALAEELAEAIGAGLACSRPIVDAKWLRKSRQVGTSGLSVKPKIYLACGISGAFQHMVGVKGTPFIVALNKNPKAPIFQVADVGVVADILEFLPDLTKAIRQLKQVDHSPESKT